jgi:hypothetical protein
MNEEIIPEDINETFADMSEAILRVAEAGEKLLQSGLTKKAIIILLHNKIGTQYITKRQIEYVLDAIPELKTYLRN